MTTKTAGIGALGAAGAAGACGGGYLLMREKTIGDRVSKSGLVLIKSDDIAAWKLAAKHLKLSDTDLVKDLSPLNSEIKDGNVDLDKAKVALKKWCQDASNKDLSDENIKTYLDKVKSRCTISPIDIKEKLKREGKSFTNNWTSKFDTIKTQTAQDTDLENNLKALNSTITEAVSSANNQKNLYSKALQDWCESKLNLKLEDNSYENTYPKVVSRCT
ncbi:hypothetical protein HF1_01800 [Mycoplasma haemofelis str. Langford 1]|uniref:Lipoprotein n=2 Tax=Mycoplasma haemofelis TaxID=29501 RepID=F6FGB7_MYCHI|nr:hypothetical protein [Mycoplasma haemofelis]AEG72507.1 hypothetical protein MHF_0208 [Mycoplasma haemofelis Ohio2]CBY92188.1 hypothetical protein HF1_01800 [Mycoplasma haemofelis str. Langford 1]